METRNYKTLKGLFKANGLSYLTLSDFIYKQVYNKNIHAYIKFTLSEEAEQEACRRLAECFCFTKPSIKKYADYIHSLRKNFGIFSRVWFELRASGKFVSTYCAGQDCPAEMRYIQHLIRNYYFC